MHALDRPHRRGPMLLAAALAAVLLVPASTAMAAPAAAASFTAAPLAAAPLAAASSKVTLSSSVSRSAVTAGTSVTIRGAYRQGPWGVSFYRVRLQQRTSGAWRTVRTVMPSATGALSTKVAPSRTTQYRWTTLSGKTVSPARKVTVTQGHAGTSSRKVTLSSSVSATKVRAGAKVTVKGTYRQGSAPISRYSVRLQKRTSGAWTTVRTVKPSRTGTLKTTVKPSRTTQYRWTTTSGKTVSKARKVTVTATSASSAKVTLSSAVTKTKVSSGTKIKVTGYYRQGKKAITRYSVRLQQRTTGSWTTVRTVRPSSTGKLSATVSPTRTTQYRWTTTSGKTVSTARKVTVAARTSGVTVSSKISATTVREGTSVTLTSAYRSNGAPVTCCYLRVQASTSGAWKTLRTLAPSASGNFTYRVTPKVTTSYRFITTSGKTVSSVRKVTVTPRSAAPSDDVPGSNTSGKIPTAFTIDGSGYGHGLGLSQYGAYQMAREGKSSTQILQHYFTDTKVADRALPDKVAVQVIGKHDPNSVTFAIDDGTWRVRTATGTSALTDISDETQGTLTVVDGKPVIVIDGVTYPKASERGATLRLHWSGTSAYKPTGTAAVARLLTTSGRAATHGTYRHGRFTVTVIGGHLNVVNDLEFAREYLYGLGEMPSSWPLEALEAQAIAGRSYALGLMKVSDDAPQGVLRASCACNVVDSTADQFFTGWKKEGEGTDQRWGKRWKAAVDSVTSSSTTGRVVLAGSHVAVTYYSSSTGGRSANSEDVWSQKVSYIRSVDDAYSLKAPGNSFALWSSSTTNPRTVTLTQARAAALFGLPDVVTIEVTERYSSEQAKSLRATSSTGATATWTAKADKFRTTLGLPGAWIRSIEPRA
ncbi:SpoIID/LytB domain-containing protein [Sanguibacter sp. A247]|uniref:SpoIID/LytB domain-containing protein n=1 Tax=unclassified Sanguibacter TaxID=2645534 RepID=UPI003FD80475